MLSLVAIYEVLQKYGKSEDEAFNIVAEEMFKFIQPSKEMFQKLSKKSWFWNVIKKIVPIGFKKGSGIGWKYTWHKDTPNQRTKTLCYGDDECNFIFIKHNKDEKFTRTEAR